jgi:putative permease
MSHHQSHSTFTRVFVVLAVLGMLFAGGYAIRHTVSCFLSSFIIAYLLDPVLVSIEKRSIKRLYGLLVLYLALSLITLFCAIYLVPLITSRWDSLVRNLPNYFQQAREIVLGMKNRIYSADGAGEWSWIIDSVAKNLDTITSKAGTGVYNTASSMAFNIFNLILSPILVFFMLLYKHEIISSIKVWLPVKQREHLLEVGREVNASIGGYLRGQLIVSAIVALFSAIALYFLDVDYALLNGLFAGLASILPFIGVILATIPPLFFAYVKFQNGLILLKVLGAFSLIYFFEGYLVKPLVFKESMNLNPLLTIVVVMALGELMGFWGIMLAIPIAAALKILSIHWRRGDFSSEA